MIAPQRVAKNTIISLGSALAQKLVTLLYFIAVANYYGPQDQGGYSSALAFATLMAVFVDLGISSAMTREVARQKTGSSVFVGQMFFLRIAACVFVYPMIILAAHVAHYPKEIISMIYIAGIIALLDTFTVAAWSTIRGFQNLLYESIGGLAGVLVMVGSGFGFIAAGLPIVSLLYSILFGSIVNFFISFFVLFCRCGFVISLRPSVSSCRQLLTLSLPFIGAAIFSRIYTFTDMSLLPLLASAHAAGWYAAAAKIMLALNIIPAAFSSSLYPAISASYIDAKERVGFLCSRGIAYLMMLALPLGTGILLLSGHIVLFVYKEAYTPTIYVWQLLVPGIIAGFLMFPLGALLAGINRQGVNTAIFALAALLNVTSNFLLIPLFAERGAAISASATYLLIFFASLYFCWPYIRPHTQYLGSMFVKICMASVAMGVCIFFLRDTIHIIFTVLAGIIVYTLTAFLFRVMNIREFRSFFITARK